MSDAYLAATGISLPPSVESDQFFKVDQKMRARHGQSKEVRERMRKLVDNAQIKTRHAMNPCWHTEEQRKELSASVEDIFSPHDFDPPAHLRARFWHEHAPKMAIEAAKAALANWKGSVQDITHVVTTSTTGWAEPGIAVELIETLGLSEDTRKIEININGCFCGASCLRTARDIVRGGESGAVLVVAVEMSSVQYNIVDTDISSLISSSLFSDGAGAAIIAPQGPWLMDKAGMSLVPNSKHMLRLNPNFERESGASKMFLHPDVPKALSQYFGEARGRRYLDDLLEGSQSYPALAIHPGGPNILEGIQQVFLERGWPQDCLSSSYATLRETGNLGSAAILFVIHKLLQETQLNRAAYFAFGPGVTVEWANLTRV
jgi:predicted naringenin-chalcone synthase